MKSALLGVTCCVGWVLLICAMGCAHNSTLANRGMPMPDDSRFTPAQAASFQAMAEGPLAPVYPLLAAQIVAEFELAERPVLGIDLGGGPGSLIVELCKQIPDSYWINADINPYNFPYFYQNLAEAGLGHRAGALFADAHALPFRGEYADVLVSRGTYQFWDDKPLAFGEILRVLKPGGVAYIGRGLPDAPLASTGTRSAQQARQRPGIRRVRSRAGTARADGRVRCPELRGARLPSSRGH